MNADLCRSSGSMALSSLQGRVPSRSRVLAAHMVRHREQAARDRQQWELHARNWKEMNVRTERQVAWSSSRSYQKRYICLFCFLMWKKWIWMSRVIYFVQPVVISQFNWDKLPLPMPGEHHSVSLSLCFQYVSLWEKEPGGREEGQIRAAQKSSEGHASRGRTALRGRDKGIKCWQESIRKAAVTGKKGDLSCWRRQKGLAFVCPAKMLHLSNRITFFLHHLSSADWKGAERLLGRKQLWWAKGE